MEGHVRPALEGEAIELQDARAGRLCLYSAEGLDANAGNAAPPVLLIHSVNAAASAYEVRPLYEALARSRPTYALDLPGYGRSDRSERPYVPRLMTDAVAAAMCEIRRRHAGAAVDALAVSTGCEFLARAAAENPDHFRTVSLVSPTGMAGRRRRDGPEGAHFGNRIVHGILSWRVWSGLLFRWLTRPGVVRYFLRRTFGSRTVDEGLWEYAVHTAKHPEAKHAPLYFLSGHLFSRDVTRLYESLQMPVWMTHGVRGDFTDYRGSTDLLAQDHWSHEVFESGALPHLEYPKAFAASLLEFIEQPRPKAA